MENYKLGKTLKELRKKYGYSQKDVYDLMGITQPTYANYENDNRSIPLDLFFKICEIYNINAQDLMNHIIKGASLELSNNTEIENTSKENIIFIKLENAFNKLSLEGKELAVQIINLLGESSFRSSFNSDYESYSNHELLAELNKIVPILQTRNIKASDFTNLDQSILTKGIQIEMDLFNEDILDKKIDEFKKDEKFLELVETSIKEFFQNNPDNGE